MGSTSVAILALYPDAGHLVPLLRIGRMLMTRYDVAIHCFVPHECIQLAVMFGLPCTSVGHALSTLARNASRQFTAQTILTGSFDVYHYDYYAAIFARTADMVAAMLGGLRGRLPDVLLVDNHKFSEIFTGIGAEIDRPVMFHDSTGGLHSRSRRLTVNVYGKPLPLWEEAGMIAAGGAYYLARQAARLYRFKSRGLSSSTAKAKRELCDLLPRCPPDRLADHVSTSAGRPSAASAKMKHHVATGLGLLEHRVRGLAPHPDRAAFGPVLDFPDLPMPANLKQWLDQQRDRSVVYVSFGSMVTVSPLRLSLLASAFAKLGSPVLWVLDGNPEVSGNPPANIRFEIVVPQTTVLAHPAVGACVTHGGSGTITESLAAGVPMVVMPVMWDQPYNAQFVHELGAGLRRDWWGATDVAVERAIASVLHDDTFTVTARAVARELRDQNGAGAVAALITSVAQTAQGAEPETLACHRAPGR